MSFIEITFRNLCRRPLRTFLTVIGIIAAMGALVLLLGLSRGADRAFVAVVMGRDTQIVAIRKGAVDMQMISCRESLGDDIAKVKGVAEVSGELISALNVFDEKAGRRMQMVVDGWAKDSFLWETLELSAGSVVQSERSYDHIPIVLGKNWADELRKSPGDMVTLLGHEMEVVGIATSQGITNRQMSFLPLDDLQLLLNKEGEVSNFNIRLDELQGESGHVEFCEVLNDRFVDLTFFPSEEIASHSAALAFIRAFTQATAIVAVIVALIVTVNTLLMSVTEQTPEIGIYSALGWRPVRILFLVLLEGLGLSLVGGLLGAALGLLALHWIASQPHLLAIETGADPALLAVGAISILVIALGGSLYPAWRASRIQPVQAIKGTST